MGYSKIFLSIGGFGSCWFVSKVAPARADREEGVPWRICPEALNSPKSPNIGAFILRIIFSGGKYRILYCESGPPKIV